MTPGDSHIKYVPKATSWHLTFWDIGKGGTVQRQTWHATKEEAKADLSAALLDLVDKIAREKALREEEKQRRMKT